MQLNVGSHRFLNALRNIGLHVLGLAMLSLGTPLDALAQVIERVDVQRVGDEAEISIRFVSPVQYQRHSPPGRGSALNVYFQLQQQERTETAHVPETLSPPHGGLTVDMSVRYPEPDSSMLVRFPDVTTYRVRQGRDNRSITIYVPGNLAVQVDSAGASTSVDANARAQLKIAKAALEKNDFPAAVETLNSLLNLPPNATSQEAQELMGQARERNGELAKARAEYGLYLKLYPEGPGADRVRERIAKLANVSTSEVAATRPARRYEDTGWQITGGVSQYRYQGKSDTVIEPPRVIICTPTTDRNNLPLNTICSDTAVANSLNAQTLARIDQNSLISSFDFTARRRSEASDSRFVVRDVNTMYYPRKPTTRRDTNRLNAAYYDETNRDMGYGVRLGRQTGTGGGVLGRFDGAAAGYSVAPKWRLNAVGGDMVEFNSPYKKSFYGASVDMQPQLESLGGSLFAIEQRTEGQLDRQAVGMEARYFDASKNYYGLLDYDTSFDALNIAMLQVNWQNQVGTNFYLMADRRRTPILQLTSAVDTQFGETLGSLTAQIPDKKLREDIVSITPLATTLSLGVMHPLTSQWQLGGDFQVSSLSSTQASSVLPMAIPNAAGTGNTLLYTARGIGNEVLFSNDMLVISGTYINASHTTAITTYTAQSYSATHIARPGDRWQIDTGLRIYSQSKSDGEKLTRLNPVLKVLYRLRNNLSFEMEANMESEKISGGASPGHATRRYYFVGYRWDFM